MNRKSPVEGKISLPQAYLTPHIAGINELARIFPKPDIGA